MARYLEAMAFLNITLNASSAFRLAAATSATTTSWPVLFAARAMAEPTLPEPITASFMSSFSSRCLR
jgi:hypothetical protein